MEEREYQLLTDIYYTQQEQLKEQKRIRWLLDNFTSTDECRFEKERPE